MSGSLEARQTSTGALQLSEPENPEGWIEMYDPVNVEAVR
jgi:hypothetical protein